MGDQDKEREGGPDRPEDEDGGREKHPEQARAEAEEEQTRRESGEPSPDSAEAADSEPGEGSDVAAGEAKEPPFPIVGIGASAGGLEALEAFFGAVPEESGLAYVVITHTDPKQQSMLPDLLRKRASIPVEQLEDRTSPRTDRVYLPPSNRDAVLEEGTLRLKVRPTQSETHMPVDRFLKDLAADRGRQAACVILSGTGTDGTQGLRLIKEQGGLAVAQDLESARHGGMPRSAAETGLVDFTLPPGEIPQRLIQYFQSPVQIRPRPEAPEKEEPDPLRRILAFLANRTRQDFSLYKENTVTRRIERRMTITDSRDASAYLRLLHQDPDEVRNLFQDLLIGVTSFFRDPQAFEFLKRQVLPDLIGRSEDQPLRIWTPGCATGEEAYSVAILLRECVEEAEAFREIQVFGTDIDPKAIERARQGSYVQNIAADVGPERLKRFFTKEGSRYRVNATVREQVVFAEQNVLEDPPFSSLDLLVCRNLLIYLKPEAQNRLIPLFHYALKPEGCLFLGSSESVGRHQELFQVVSKQHNVYRKKGHKVHAQVQFPTRSRKLERPGEPEPAAGPAGMESVGKAAEKLIAAEHTPACVVVNEEGEILHFHGRTGSYLEPASGEPTLQIADMAREGLRFAVLAAMRRAREKNEVERQRDVRVKTNGGYQRIDLVVQPLEDPPLENCLLILFQERPEPPEPEKEVEEEGAPPREGDGERVEELEQELMRVRQDYRSAMEELQTSNEELRSSNEELHSSNEELQSTNEELESSREELQSLNEELNTVNSELNSKMSEIREAYNAVNSVLDNTRIAIVFLDKDLQVTRFTPEANELLNLIDSDVDRPLHQINHNLEVEDLAGLARSVLKELSTVDEEVRTQEGAWYRMRIMIYRPEDGVIEGVVLTFVNIDAQKEAQEQMREMGEQAALAERRYAQSIVDTVRESLLVLNGDLQVVAANRNFYQTFGTSADATEGASLFDLQEGGWDFPELRTLLREILDQDRIFEGYRVEHDFPGIGHKRFLLNARKLRVESEEADRVLLALEERTGDAESGDRSGEAT